MVLVSEKRVYRERCRMMARVQGGYLHVYDIIDGDRVIGTKSIHGVTKTRTETKIYTLGDRQFATAKEFVAAYEAPHA